MGWTVHMAGATTSKADEEKVRDAFVKLAKTLGKDHAIHAGTFSGDHGGADLRAEAHQDASDQ